MSKFDLKLSLSTIAIDTKIKHDNTMKNGNKITLFLEVFLNVVSWFTHHATQLCLVVEPTVIDIFVSI